MDELDSFEHRPELRFCTTTKAPESRLRLKLNSASHPGFEQYEGRCGSSRRVVSAPVGTGVYFTNYSYNDTHSSLQNLFLLASVSCETESILSWHRQLVRKRRTPRSFKIINSSRFLNATSREQTFPSAGAKRQSMESVLNISAHEPSLSDHGGAAAAVAAPSNYAFDNSKKLKSSNGNPKIVIPKFCQPVTGKIIGQLAVPINKLVKGGMVRLPSSKRATKVPKRIGRHETRVQRVSKTILQFIGEGTTAEKFIRAALGNNPDTSKALRLLMTEHKIKRVGVGGRGKAFLYAATTSGLRELEELKHMITHDNSTITEVPFRLDYSE